MSCAAKPGLPGRLFFYGETLANGQQCQPYWAISSQFRSSACAPTRKETIPSMSSGMPLLAIIALPFIGSLVAAFLRQDARNGAAFLAGTIALCGAVLTAVQYPVPLQILT